MDESRPGSKGARVLAPAKEEGPPAGLWERPRLSGLSTTRARGPSDRLGATGRSHSVPIRRDRFSSASRSVQFCAEITGSIRLPGIELPKCAGGDSAHHAVIRNILGDHRARRHDDVIAHCSSGKDDNIPAEPHVIPDMHR